VEESVTQFEPDRFRFTSTDGLSIACVKWSGHHASRRVMQIVHGLGEHMGRYAERAETLVHREFVVYGNDHRSHGLTARGPTERIQVISYYRRTKRTRKQAIRWWSSRPWCGR